VKSIMKLNTPVFLLDLDILEDNIRTYQKAADDNKKELWPMTKTHKSTEIALLQQDAGAKGFLCGTLDECEMLVSAGIINIMYAYPIVSEPNISRIIKLSKTCNFLLRIDDAMQAKILNEHARNAKVFLNFTVIINSGLDRFGIEPNDAGEFLKSVKPFKNLVFKGFCTHPGHVYGANSYEEVVLIAKEETEAIESALRGLAKRQVGEKQTADVEKLETGAEQATEAEAESRLFAGAEAESARLKAESQPEFIGTGSTPTYHMVVNNAKINKFHPGNYVFMDNIQISLGIAKEENCALTVLATVVSNPRNGTYIIDAGSKCLGLDKGAHGSSNITGFGLVKGRKDITIDRLSEEVGIITCEQGILNIGDKIEIIPNHSCSSANMTSYYICKRGETVAATFKVDMRGNSRNLL